uniref:Translation initiation factor IF-2, chloroplastic n=1 Tax=Centroceras clavulatum TaxID=159503 RepID=A0A4D6WR26_9FLOR|nr:Translation initiation factor 2 [Centroceras clavulatum]
MVNPKLIDNLTINLVSNTKSIVDINNNTIETQDTNNNTYHTNKFEKKYKSNSHTEDILEIKKKKNKSLKKNRKQINLEGDELFRNNNTQVILNQDSFNNDIVKVPKVNKNKKKSKNQDNSNLSEITISNNLNKEIFFDGPLTIQELSNKLNIPVAEIIKYLFLKGVSVTINQIIDIPIASEIATQYNFFVKDKDSNVLKDFEQKSTIQSVNNKSIARDPIITVLGHVDHGKTTLLDSILDTNLVIKEFGGITQSIKSHEIEWLYNNKLYNLVFLDTPGHQAFTSMRTRGAQVTDIALLVVAADDGLKPQTIESIKYIFEKHLPYIIVINKIDKTGINTLKVREELAEYNILDESWGGNSIIIEVSALKKQNIDVLLSNICQLYELQDLKTNPNDFAVGTILETYLDIQKGPVTTLAIKDGSIKVGDFIISGNMYGKTKILINNKGKKVDRAFAASIIQMLGFSKLPQAGQSFNVVPSKQAAVDNINQNILLNKSIQINNLNNRVSWQSITNNVNLKKINLILKTDTQGSIEAIVNAFNNISQKKVQINILSISLGNISNNDIELASASNSIIIGFNINISNQITNLAKQLSVSIQTFNIIYDLLDYVTATMLSLVEPEYSKLIIGKATVQDVFYINKGSVAGCLVIEGKLSKNCYISIYDNSTLMHTGTLNSLKRIKDDVNEVLQNTECGVLCNSYNLWKTGNLIEAYELKQKEKVL